jgi:hypothetical protein
MDYFATNSLAAFSIVSGNPTEVTSSGFDATYTDRVISPSVSVAGVIQSPNWINPTTGVQTDLTDFWFHADFLAGNASGTPTVIAFYNSAGVAVVRLIQTTNGTFRLDYWNGAAFVNGTAINITTGRTTIDIHVVCGASGSLVWFANNTQIYALSGLNAAVTNCRYIQLSSATTSAGWSQILISDTNTIGAKVADLKPNANGANTAWANDFNNVVKTGINDTTFISSTTLGDKESYAASDVTLPTAQYFVSSVWFSIRARTNSVSPQNIKPLMRIGGVDYAGAYNFAGLGSTTFAPSIAGFANDPSSGAAWVGVTNVNAAEIGFQTAA